MRKSTGPAARYVLGVLSAVALSATLISSPSASAPREAARIPFAQRYHAVQHGGIVTAANSVISCRAANPTVASCLRVRRGGQGANGDFDMFYSDVDKDPNTYNSTRAELTLPPDSQVSYARLYWGANLRVGEQKAPQDNGRVLIAEPGGAYKEVLADTRIAHRTADGSDAFQASADVTRLIRSSGSGLYTVAQVNVARGRSAAGAWGGWNAWLSPTGTTGSRTGSSPSGTVSKRSVRTSNAVRDLAGPLPPAPGRRAGRCGGR